MWQTAFEKAAEHAGTYVTSGHLPTALVAVATSKERVGLRAFGLDGKEPALWEKRFALASISKAISGVGIACLVDRGKLDYTTPVCEIIPEFGTNDQRRRIAVGDIFTHTTGLPGRGAAEVTKAGCPPDLCRRWLVEDELLYEPGAEMLYTSYTYQLLNWIVERLLDVEMSAFLEEYVFTPAGMTGTSYRPGPEERTVPTVDHPVADPEDMERYCRLEMSGSGMWSTASDLVRLGQVLLQPGRLMRPETFERTTVARSTVIRRGTDEPSCRTWGWVKEPQAAFPLQTETGFYHGGATGTLLWIDPPRDLIFVFLANRWGSGNDHAFATLNVLYGGDGV